jgi:hypothetical protein
VKEIMHLLSFSSLPQTLSKKTKLQFFQEKFSTFSLKKWVLAINHEPHLPF